ncbi:MAG: ABC transporter substrate-binding protein [Casimicrobiaceae bacterium]
MRRRFLGQAIGLSLAGLVGARVADAQQPKGKPRVAYVFIFKEGPSSPFVQSFTDGLRKLGWVDGQNVTIDVRDADGNPDKLNAIMRELVDSKVDVIVSACTPEAKVAAKYTSTIPIVMAAGGDPVAAGLATNYARPGANITGISGMMLDLSGKRLAILKEAFPAITHATVLWNPERPDNVPEVKAMQDAGKTLGIRLDSQQVRTPVELADALELLSTTGTQAILNAGDTLLANQAPKVIAYCANRRLPALYESRYWVDDGGLMSYGPNLASMHYNVARYVDKILKGAKPGDLPIQQPTKFELVINLKTASALGFKIPRSVLLQADEVVR